MRRRAAITMTSAMPTVDSQTTGHARLRGSVCGGVGATAVASVVGLGAGALVVVVAVVVAVLVTVSVGAGVGSGRGLRSFSGMTTSANSGIAASTSTASVFMMR